MAGPRAGGARTGGPGPRPDPAIAAIRLAVRAALADLPAAAPVGVAFSGGPDSTALLAAACFERAARVTALLVDHHWHAGSGAVVERAARVARTLGADAVVLDAPTGRSEADAREARYAALDDAAAARGLVAVLLGHTRDDQAESVLLGLVRGSGARSLAGMPAVRGRYRRPLLDLPRASTVAACRAAGLETYADPANDDAAFLRTRARGQALPALAALLAEELGRDVAPNLARTARMLRADADLLDVLAADAAEAARSAHHPDALDVAALLDLAPALRSRVLHRWAADLCGGAPLAEHVDRLDALVTAWRGQGPVALPGGQRARRASGRIERVPVDLTTLPHATSGAGGGQVPEGAPGGTPGLPPGIVRIVVREDEIRARIAQLAAEIDAAHEGHDVVLVAVLKGAVMVVADLSRALTVNTSIEFMAVSSYGAATSSSGVVRILKDLDRDISGKHVVIVEDIVDSGLTLSWLVRNLQARHPASLEVCTLLRKPEALKVAVPVRWVGYDIGPDFVVGYGLDYAEKYRGLPYVGLLDPGATRV